MPPAPKAEVALSVGGHGWVNFSLDGKFAWCHTPDMFDARTKRLVAILRDKNGKRVGGSKLIEVQFRDGKVVGMGSEFGMGRKRPLAGSRLRSRRFVRREADIGEALGDV